MLLPRVCNPCMLQMGVGPRLRGRSDDVSDRLSIIDMSRGPTDGTADSLESAAGHCKPTLPRLKGERSSHLVVGCVSGERSDHRNIKDLFVKKNRRAAAEPHAMQTKTRVTATIADMAELTARLQCLSQEAPQACAEEAGPLSVAVNLSSAQKAVARFAENETDDALWESAQSVQTCAANTCVSRGKCAIM